MNRKDAEAAMVEKSTVYLYDYTKRCVLGVNIASFVYTVGERGEDLILANVQSKCGVWRDVVTIDLLAFNVVDATRHYVMVSARNACRAFEDAKKRCREILNEQGISVLPFAIDAWHLWHQFVYISDSIPVDYNKEDSDG
jgi:hypothetical protein